MTTPKKKNCLSLSITAFESTRQLLSESDRDEIRALIYDQNEWGLGIELLVDVLLENHICVTHEQKEKITRAMDEMELDRGQQDIKVQQ